MTEKLLAGFEWAAPGGPPVIVLPQLPRPRGDRLVLVNGHPMVLTTAMFGEESIPILQELLQPDPYGRDPWKLDPRGWYFTNGPLPYATRRMLERFRRAAMTIFDKHSYLTLVEPIVDRLEEAISTSDPIQVLDTFATAERCLTQMVDAGHVRVQPYRDHIRWRLGVIAGTFRRLLLERLVAGRLMRSEPLPIRSRTRGLALKLNRFPNMKLSQMQDIGGCRAVVKSVAAVRGLDAFYRRKSSIKHSLASRDDSISIPQASGYRGVHLVYRYFSDKQAKEVYNGLKIEMQLRSQYQHAWATAVETVGTFVQEALKSSTGPEEWLRFFTLMGSVIALRERTPPVPNTPPKREELIAELDDYSYILNVENRLRGYADALQKIEERAQHAYYYLLKLDPGASQLIITGFQRDELEAAQKAYLMAERTVKENPGTDAVLVSVDSLAALPRAYPNYFADTRIFVQLLKQALSGYQRRIFTGALKLPA